MPSGSHLEDLAAISQLLHWYSPKKVLILGDWIHQKSSWTEELIADLTRFFEVHWAQEWTLILGNHEKGSLEFLKKFPLQILTEDLRIGRFTFSHGHSHAANESESGTARKKSGEAKAHFSIEGHIHPAVRLREGSTNLKLPAFFLRKKTLLLPAFGSQTGGYELKPTKNDRIFPTTGKVLFEL
jgi:metallophosphoesterase superfamily enzyme